MVQRFLRLRPAGHAYEPYPTHMQWYAKSRVALLVKQRGWLMSNNPWRVGNICEPTTVAIAHHLKIIDTLPRFLNEDLLLHWASATSP